MYTNIYVYPGLDIRINPKVIPLRKLANYFLNWFTVIRNLFALLFFRHKTSLKEGKKGLCESI